MDGRPRFEWEALRHKMILDNDQTVVQVCASCPLNIMQGAEGCKSTLYGLDIFLAAVARLAPDSPWANLELDSTALNAAVTRELLGDLQELEVLFGSTTWKVAQLFEDGEPALHYFDDGSSRPKIFPWNGEAPPHLINANEGYQLFLCAHGLVVKSNFDDPIPHVFVKLTREPGGVTGTTAQGETIGFNMSMARYPEWDKENPRGYGELRLVDMNAAEVFRDTLDMLMVFTGVASQAETGVIINPV